MLCHRCQQEQAQLTGEYWQFCARCEVRGQVEQEFTDEWESHSCYQNCDEPHLSDEDD